MEDEVRLRRVAVTLSLGLIGGVALSWRLWFLTHFYPAVPVLEIPDLPAVPWNSFLSAAMLVSAAFCALTSRRAPAGVLAITGVFLALLDQSRLQPWFYQYCFMFAALCFCRAKGPYPGPSALNTCRIIVVSVYFWSGAQKLNASFFAGARHFAEPLLGPPLPAQLSTALLAMLPLAPVIEIAIGASLLSRRSRSAAVWAAVAMHAAILTVLGPFGLRTNSVIWPWNAAMAALVPLLFWKAGESSAQLLKPKDVFSAAMLLLFLIMPCFSLINKWDSYLSMTLYSGNTARAVMEMGAADSKKLPQSLQPYALEDGSGRRTVKIYDWSMNELNVPPYPEERIFRKAGLTLCQRFGPGSDAVLIVERKPGLLTGSRDKTSFSCP